MPKVVLIGNEEQRLVNRLQEGDKTAAREFYDFYADSLAGVVARYIADEEDLKDVFQNALIHLFSHIGDFEYRGTGSLEAWATKVVVNESLKFLRTKEQHELLQHDYDVPDEPEDDLSVSDIPPDVLRQMLSHLPTGYRTVLNLYVFEGKSHQEIARMLGIKKDSSASQLLRAKNMLMKMIRKYNDNNPPRR
ncbi:MAG: sigma-70 family RNA polymerase sigma factor [Prevotella sp.]|nr:sigma-70 family RNA polymerase sigma factor [Prevotella sp.]